MFHAPTPCPYCGVEMEVPSELTLRSTVELTKDNSLGARTFVMLIEICPNQRCRGLRAAMTMYPMREDQRGTLRMVLEPEREWQLIPVGARALPEYVPLHVRKEYEEASAVRVVSPNAAATLARRCLQAMIRDFWGITKGMLSAEIDALREKIEAETWNAIENVRATGKIGQHLEKGANLVLEADPGEVDVMLNLIEFLVDEWYVARHRRQARLSAMRETTSVSAGTTSAGTSSAMGGRSMPPAAGAHAEAHSAPVVITPTAPARASSAGVPPVPPAPLGLPPIPPKRG